MGLNTQNAHFAKVTRTTATLSIAVSGTPQVVPFEAALNGDGNKFGLWSSTTNPSRITIQKNGFYMVFGGVTFAASATGDREIYVVKSGAGAFGRVTIKSATLANPLTCCTFMKLVRGDYVELFVNQTSGGALNITTTAANEDPYFGVMLMYPEYDFITSEITAG